MDASGLIFPQTHIWNARENRDIQPFASAWNAFGTIEISDTIGAINYGALRWLLMDDAPAGERAVAALENLALDVSDQSVIDVCRHIFALCQALVCLDGHPALTGERRTQAYAWIEPILAAQTAAASHERAWIALATMSFGVAARRQDMLDSGAELFREIVRLIVPHGYIPALVEAKDDGSLTRSIQLAHALTLGAEVGEHAGLKLWEYDHRGVSVMTAALYPLYYYYYPEKWPWKVNSPFEIGRKLSSKERAKLSKGEVELEPTQAVFQQHAAYLEIINRRSAGSVRAVTLILDELRPIIDVLGGGAVTLTHALPPPPKRRGLFGR